MCNDELPESDPRSADTRPVDTGPTDHYPIADESDAQVDPDECPQDTCTRVGHEWQAVWDGPWTSWGSRTVTVSYDECARCGAVENYWESPLGA